MQTYEQGQKQSSSRTCTELSEPRFFPVSIVKKCTEEMYAKEIEF